MKNEDQPVPIFPQQQLSTNDHVEGGLTKREYFAAMAMQGILASIENAEGLTENGKDAVAQTAIKCADALLLNLT